MGLGGGLMFLSLLSATALYAQRGRIESRNRDRALEAMERRLFDLTNEERQKYGLRPVRLSVDLTQLARRHSADMAGHDRLSHDSSTGESYKDRLVTAGFYFSRAGENVARSGVGLPDLIHGSLMASLGHRENILNPDFDTVGIGAAISDDGVFFVTQDFLKPIEVLNPEESERRAVLKAQDIRKARAVPPLVWDTKAGATARKLAQARAAGRALPAIPDSLGEVSAYFVDAPDFDGLEVYAAEIGRPDCREGGLGIAFGRSGEHRGGGYFMVLLLFPSNRYLDMSEREQNEIVRGAFNEHRRMKGVRELLWRDGLARDAGLLSATSVPTRRQRLRGAAPVRQKVFTSYETIDLKQIPAGIEASVIDPVLSGIGLKVVFEKTREFPRGAFHVTVVVQ
ncbi:MAG: hypothetical protein A2W03_07925 [Candidatus Aminicenantes bacterium RBG_16_63_16]|nr:MAG: hypothetical protein A2W03_07925 [Candidatus Aminicenantes bacterium RBG_16_63_16]